MKNAYTYIVTLALLLLTPPAAAQQQISPNLTSRQRPIQVTMMALYQSYEEDGSGADQLSFPLRIMYPIGQKMSVSLSASQMGVFGSDVSSLSGMSDTQISFGYAHTMGSASLNIGLGLNLPSGTRELTTDEFDTLIRVSQTAFDYRVPGLGQGFGVSPIVTFAFPVSDNLAIGLGASYRMRGGFKPLEGMEEDYTPGDELLFTVGIDTRVGETSSFSIDATFTRYASDKLGDEVVFEAGGKTSITALFRHVEGFNQWRVVVLYRARAKSDLGGGALAGESVQSVPNELMGRVSYERRINARLSTTFLAEAHSFDETSAYQARTVIDVGAVPTYRLSQKTSLVGRAIYTLGTITGFEVGAGLAVRL